MSASQNHFIWTFNFVVKICTERKLCKGLKQVCFYAQSISKFSVSALKYLSFLQKLFARVPCVHVWYSFNTNLLNTNQYFIPLLCWWSPSVLLTVIVSCMSFFFRMYGTKFTLNFPNVSINGIVTVFTPIHNFYIFSHMWPNKLVKQSPYIWSKLITAKNHSSIIEYFIIVSLHRFKLNDWLISFQPSLFELFYVSDFNDISCNGFLW